MTEPAVDFGKLIEPVARKLWGDPNPRLSKASELRWGNQGARIVYPERGAFKDTERNVQGGTIALVELEEGCDKAGAVAWLEREGILEPRRVIAQRGPASAHAVYLKAGQRIVASFEFRKAGQLHYRKHRIEPGEGGRSKDYKYDHPDGNGGWKVGRGPAEQIPYRCDDLAGTGLIFLAEGEAKADKLASWGLVATSLKDWRKEFAPYVAGRTCVILPDNDESGAMQAADTKRKLETAGAIVVVIELPGLPPAGDILDWKGTPAELEALVEQAKPKPKQPAYLNGISATALMAKHFEPVRYVVDQLLAEGVTLFGGAPKIGKSWFAYDLALAIPLGRPVFGRLPVEQGDVLYLALEDNQRRLRSRLLKKGVTAPERLTLMTEWPTLDAGCIEELTAWADAVAKPVLVIVDVLKMVRGITRGTESLYDADYRALTGLATWGRSRGIAVLVVHHVRKMASEDPLESLSGTNGLTGAADSVMVLKRDIGTGNCLLYVRGRDIEESELAVRFKPDNGTWEMLGAAEEVGRTTERDSILNALRQAGNPLSAREVSDILGRNYDAVRKCLSRMAHADEVTKIGRGQYTCPNSPNVPNSPQPDIVTHGTGGIGREDNRPRFPAPDQSEEVDFPIGEGAWHPNPALGRRRGRDGSILAPGETGDEPVPGWR